MIQGVTWSDEQERAINTVDTSVIVSASAGSGKTTLMIERILRLIAKGHSLERMLVVTFATAQAEDMKAKLARNLTLAAQDAEPSLAVLLRKQSFSLSAASISTLHSYCADLVRRNAYLVDVDPAFVISAEVDTEIRKQAAVEQTVRAAVRRGGETFDKLYDALLRKRKHDKLAKLIRRVAELNATLADGDLQRITEEGIAHAQADYEATEAEVFRAFARRFRTFAERDDVPEYQKAYCLARAEWCDSLCRQTCPSDQLRAPKGVTDNEQTKQLLRKYMERLNKFLKKREELEAAPQAQREFPAAVIALTHEYEQAYAALKAADGVLDFNDLEHYAYRLLQDAVVAQGERERFDFVFVDEFQDINPLQQAILRALSRDNVFMVGDVKQSIYGFRLCDSTIFSAEYDRLSLRGTAIDLNTNYRSAREILDFCNFVFGTLYTVDFGGLDYAGRAAFRGGSDKVRGEVEVHLIRSSRTTETVQAEQVYSVREDNGTTEETTRGYTEGKLIAGRIAALRARTDAGERIRYGDIAVLTRTMGAETLSLIAALRDSGVPVSVRRDYNLFESPGVCALLNLLRVLVNPRQDHALLGVMTSALFGFGEQELVTLRLSHRGVAFHQAVYGYPTRMGEGTDRVLCDKVRAMLDTLSRLRELSRYETPYDVLMHAVRQTDYLTALLARPDGDAEHDLVQYFLRELSVSRHNSSAVAYLDFVSACDKLSVEVTEGAEDAVTVTTIHKSKGLEWRAVFVALLGRNYNMKDLNDVAILDKRYGVMLRNFDFAVRDSVKNKSFLQARLPIRRKLMEEELRILYVALTRAKQFLALVGTDGFRSCYGAEDAYARLTGTSPLQLLLGVLATDLTKRDSGLFFDGAGVVPQCSYSLSLHEPDTLITPVGPPSVTGADEELVAALRADWARPYPYATDTLQKTTATIRADAVAITVARDATGFARDGDATEVGNAYHEIMQYIDLATRDVRAEIDRLVREGKTSAERAALVDAERIALACEAVRALGGRVRRELGFLSTVRESELYGKGDGDVIVQGIIDLLVEWDDGVWIVDYKTTDASPSYLRERYRAQLDTYADACRKAGMTVKEKRIWSFVYNAWVVFEDESGQPD